ncbi:MAG: methyltransferase domain-containing protein [Nitrospirae bacterium]|nr:MAG: methyltransferase domain-containing protein [Nitrospirota bacterium]
MPVGIDTSTLSLRCPRCKADLRKGQTGYDCAGCGEAYPVRGDVVRMVPSLTRVEEQTRQAFDFEHRRYRSAAYLRISPDLIQAWLADVQLPRDHFKGKTVLDVGCGSGRWTYAMASLGAKVVAVDVSDAAVEITRAVTSGLGEVTVIQASVFQLPFRPEQFDFVVSWGVLHHTCHTETAFRAIAPLVRPGGWLHVMVYERRNPIKVWGTEMLRKVMRRLSPERRYRWCGRLVIGNRLVFQLVRGFIACVPSGDLTATLDAETAQFGLYDWYSPRYNHLHRVAEVCGWFRNAGFEDLCVTSPIKYRRRLDVFRFGQCGGAISLRGKRRAGGASEGSAGIEERRLADVVGAAV